LAVDVILQVVKEGDKLRLDWKRNLKSIGEEKQLVGLLQKLIDDLTRGWATPDDFDDTYDPGEIYDDYPELETQACGIDYSSITRDDY